MGYYPHRPWRARRGKRQPSGAAAASARRKRLPSPRGRPREGRGCPGPAPAFRLGALPTLRAQRSHAAANGSRPEHVRGRKGAAAPPPPAPPLSARRPRPPKMAPRQEMAPRRPRSSGGVPAPSPSASPPAARSGPPGAPPPAPTSKETRPKGSPSTAMSKNTVGLTMVGLRGMFRGGGVCKAARAPPPASLIAGSGPAHGRSRASSLANRDRGSVEVTVWLGLWVEMAPERRDEIGRAHV